MGNGSLGNLLQSDKDNRLSRHGRETRLARIITGIAIRMRYLHSEGIMHGNLTPDNILLDWDLIPRVADFGHSARQGQDQEQLGSFTNAGSDIDPFNLHRDGRYLAPECFERQGKMMVDVFAFGLVLYEIVANQSPFQEGLTELEIMKQRIKGQEPAVIPSFVVPEVGELIDDCWAFNPNDRPTFCAIVDRLKSMEFQLMPGVESSKVKSFLKTIEDWEAKFCLRLMDSEA
jgi:serine/threonine protein kinase